MQSEPNEKNNHGLGVQHFFGLLSIVSTYFIFIFLWGRGGGVVIQFPYYVKPGKAALAARLLINSLPDDKILDWSKLKQIADDI